MPTELNKRLVKYMSDSTIINRESLYRQFYFKLDAACNTFTGRRGDIIIDYYIDGLGNEIVAKLLRKYKRDPDSKHSCMRMSVNQSCIIKG